MTLSAGAGDEIAAADDQKPAMAVKSGEKWDLDHEEKARKIADEDLNRKNKQVYHSIMSSPTRLPPPPESSNYIDSQ